MTTTTIPTTGEPSPDRPGRLYARGNYGLNVFCQDPLDENDPNALQYDSPDLVHVNATAWGGGIGGINRSLRFSDIPAGLSNMIGVDEIRAGHPSARSPRNVGSGHGRRQPDRTQ